MKKLIFVFLLFGCVSVKPLSRFPIELGATTQEVASYFGSPRDFHVYGDEEQWIYNFTLGEVDGKVVKVYGEYGAENMYLYFKHGRLINYQY